MSSIAVPPSALTVRLLADPGLPTARMDAIRDRLANSLSELFSMDVSVRLTTEMIRLAEDENIDVGSTVDAHGDDTDADAVLSLTEMPRIHNRLPLVAEVVRERRTAVIAYPTVGVLSTHDRLHDLLVLCAAQLLPDLPRSHELPRGTMSGHSVTDDETGVLRLHASPVIGVWRTVLGMTATNEPWRTVPKLGRALALAGAAGAFGIFYSTVWQMSAALSPLRLALISGVAIGAMSLWLIAGNRLWERSRGENSLTITLYYNLSTLVTIITSVALLYSALFVLILVAGLIVIDPDFLATELGRESHVQNYIDIAWLSASLGVCAGGLGASFDSQTDISSLTHSQRERRRLPDSEAELQSDGA